MTKFLVIHFLECPYLQNHFRQDWMNVATWYHVRGATTRRWRSRLFSPKFGMDGWVFALALRQNSFVDRGTMEAPSRTRSRSPSSSSLSSSYCRPPLSFSCVLQFFIRICILLRALCIGSVPTMYANLWAPDNRMRFWMVQPTKYLPNISTYTMWQMDDSGPGAIWPQEN